MHPEDESPAAFGGVVEIDLAEMTKHPHFERLHDDDEFVDEVRIETVPRYKTSGLSGDEWRFSAYLTFYRKGTLVYRRRFRHMSNALAYAPWALLARDGWDEETAKGLNEGPDLYGLNFDDYCMNPGCKELATVEVRKLRDYSREGYFKDLTRDWEDYRRRWCDRHKKRGDCGLDDADSNYVLTRVKVDGDWVSRASDQA